MNWGKGITIFMIAFMSFIVSMVYHAFTKNADLIEENYYENEVNYDRNKASKSNYAQLTDKITLTQREDGIVFTFPSQIKPETEGKIIFYRPDQKKYDREFELQVNDKNEQVLDYTHFREGYYDVSVEWSDGIKSYIFEDHIQF